MKKSVLRRSMSGVAMAGAALLLIGIGCNIAGARVNTTRSIAVGLYWATTAPLEKGAYVMFCPPDAPIFREAKLRGYIGGGFCPGGYGYVMKRVAAVAGDTVSMTENGFMVDGSVLPLSRALTTDKAGRSLPHFQANHYTLRGPELLLMSDVSATSFDGRYFGPINRDQIQGVIRPILTW